MTRDEENLLTRRYLLWCYKSTKEALDRIDRKFTQVQVDRNLLNSLENEAVSYACSELGEKIESFKKYIQDKEKSGLEEKYVDFKKEVLQPEYIYLQLRLRAVEKAIGIFLGDGELAKIQNLYENEMSRRILEARDH
ncbi:MAG: hypothetical protein NUV91_06465 [Candidatus Omnitrophica bacterium]|nr:hypothetical protein [Candidatus Omnitrophota bacterium]